MNDFRKKHLIVRSPCSHVSKRVKTAVLKRFK